MARKINSFELDGEEPIEGVSFLMSQSLPAPAPLSEEWVRANPRLTTDLLIKLGLMD